MVKSNQDDRIYLSKPDVGPRERAALIEAFESGWIAPAGPDLQAFEHELSEYTEALSCVALSSGSAALHLALLCSGVTQGDEVIVQSATFAASAFAVIHAGAKPIFCDSEASTWCLDPIVLEEFLQRRAAHGRLPAAVMPVDLFGSVADYEAIEAVCASYDMPIVRDAAEALGSIGAAGHVGVPGVPTAVSFNGNKIMTTSSGGALLGQQDVVDRARYLATQARMPVVHYEHTDIGFNYRLSNLLAALGRAQLSRLEAKVERRTQIAEKYRAAFPEFTWCPFEKTLRPNHWLNVALLRPGVDPSRLCMGLDELGIEARPAWKPMHSQPIFEGNEFLPGAGVASELFARGICLPSGSSMSDADIDRVVEGVRSLVPG